MPHILTVWHDSRPDTFRRVLCITPYTFDRLLETLSNDLVFENHSQNDQMPVSHQLAITLFRFGHYGNAASLDNMAVWAGYAKGTVLLATRQVMTAILRPDFMRSVVRMPTADEKEKAKQWVENHSCSAWHDGWCMVDGTLICLYHRPNWYGESYFDRKANYSLNIQVGLQIYTFGGLLDDKYFILDCLPAQSSHH